MLGVYLLRDLCVVCVCVPICRQGIDRPTDFDNYSFSELVDVGLSPGQVKAIKDARLKATGGPAGHSHAVYGADKFYNTSNMDVRNTARAPRTGRPVNHTLTWIMPPYGLYGVEYVDQHPLRPFFGRRSQIINQIINQTLTGASGFELCFWWLFLFLSDPSTFGAGRVQPKHFSNPDSVITKFKSQGMYDCVSGKTLCQWGGWTSKSCKPRCGAPVRRICGTRTGWHQAPSSPHNRSVTHT